MEPAGFRIITSLKVVITSLKVVITNSKVVITSLKVVIIRKPAGSISFFCIYGFRISVFSRKKSVFYGSPQVPFCFSVFMDFEFPYFREKSPFLREKIRIYVKTNPFLRKNKSIFT